MPHRLLKLLDPLQADVPTSLITCILGAGFSAMGVIAATVAGWYVKLAAIDPAELAIQPLHVVLIGFIIALATFIVLILRAVWGKGLSTVDRFSTSIDRLVVQIESLAKTQGERLEKLEGLSFDALRDSVKSSKNQ